jgi:predicted RNase H-like HicB family nuclease
LIAAPAKSLVMDARSYAVVLEPEPEGGYSAHIPAFRGAHTQGETVEEALSNARDVIAGYVEVLTERGEPIPPSDLATSVAIAISAA